jgi:hypothetical protein
VRVRTATVPAAHVVADEETADHVAGPVPSGQDRGEADSRRVEEGGGGHDPAGASRRDDRRRDADGIGDRGVPAGVAVVKVTCAVQERRSLEDEPLEDLSRQNGPADRDRGHERQRAPMPDERERGEHADREDERPDADRPQKVARRAAGVAGDRASVEGILIE